MPMDLQNWDWEDERLAGGFTKYRFRVEDSIFTDSLLSLEQEGFCQRSLAKKPTSRGLRASDTDIRL